jgi:phage protein D
MSLDIIKLEEKYRDLYAPTFRIEVGGRDVVTEHALEVVSVNVETMLQGSDSFNFVINNAFDWKQREFVKGISLFDIGAEVKVFMGYTGRVKPTMMIAGPITAVKTSFPSGGTPQVTVRGFDKAHRMTKKSHSEPWDEKRDSDVVADIAVRHGLIPKVTNTDIVLDRVEQSHESDDQFLRRLADRNGFEVYALGDELHFAPPATDRSGVVELEWGVSLLSFTPEVNLSDQVTDVDLVGWSPARKDTIVGRAKAGQETGRESARRSGAEVARKVYGDSGAKLRMRTTGFNQQQIERQAKALLQRRAEQFVTGSAEAIGVPDLRPGTNVILKGLGRQFSRTYYVESASHSISTSGYSTSFRVKETTA